MNSEAKIIIAFIFNRSGKTELKESEIYLPLSMELGWFTIKESQEFIYYAIKRGLLSKKDDLLRPNFPVEKIIVPLGFVPSKKVLSNKLAEVVKRENIIDNFIVTISSLINYSEEELLEEIKRQEKEKNLLFEVAVLLVARRYNVDITEWFDPIENLFFKENIE